MKDRNQSPLGNSAADASKASQPGMKNSVMDFAPLNASTDPLNLSMNFKGNLEDAANYYYKEANKLYIANLVLNNQLKTVMEEKNQLAHRLAKLEKERGQSALVEQKKKRHRRTANQIQRTYRCPVEPCQKAYGSEGSLSQHLKLKHHDFYQSHMINMEMDDKPDKLKDEQDSGQEESFKQKKGKQDIVI